MIHIKPIKEVLANLPMSPNYDLGSGYDFIIPIPQHSSLSKLFYNGRYGRYIKCEYKSIVHRLSLSKNGYPIMFTNIVIDSSRDICKNMNSFELNNSNKILFMICQAIHKSNYGI